MANCDNTGECYDRASTSSAPAAAPVVKESIGYSKNGFNFIHWRIIIILCMLVAYIAWATFYTMIQFREGSIFLFLISGVSGVTALLACAVCLDILRYDPAASYTAGPLLIHYFLLLTIKILGGLSWRTLQKATRNPIEYQHQLLTGLLSKNADTEYGKVWNFHNIKKRDDFKRLHPLTNYDHYRDYVTKIMNGEKKSILTKEEAVFMSMTSGTTGTPKIFPVNKGYKLTTLWVCFGVLYRFKSMFNLGRNQTFRLYPKPREAPNGLSMGGITAHLFKPMPHHLTPPSFAKLYQERPAFYALAMSMLAERDLRFIEGYSSNLLYAFFKFIERNIAQICQCVESGEISEGFGIAAPVKQELEARLQKDPVRAQFLRQEFSKGINSLAKRIWPRMSYLTCVKTGSFQHCAKLLQRSYLNGIPLINVLHVATAIVIDEFVEGNIGALLCDDIEGSEFTFLPHSNFYEFIPEEQMDQPEPETFFIDQLETGRNYELVLTNDLGLYRYRLGDVVHITGKYHNTPTYTFEYRTGQIMSINQEKLPESIVYKALEKTMKNFPNITLIDYTATESFSIEPLTGQRNIENAYIFFVELEGIFTDKLAEQFDECLCREFYPYKQYRLKGSISPLKLIQVKKGTFDELKTRMMGEYVNSQFKQPRVMRNEDHLQFLLERQLISVYPLAFL